MSVARSDAAPPLRPACQVLSGPMRLGALALAAAVCGGMGWPLTWGPGEDSFPLSSFPMFSAGRPNAELTVAHALGVCPAPSCAEGRRFLSPWLSSGNREVLQSMRLTATAMAQGPSIAAEYCRRAAARVAQEPALRLVHSIELAFSHYDARRYFAGDPRPLWRQVVHRCAVQR
ncbi:MAG: hypothetical protein ACPGUV_08705 [Polyangiales bacterium]